MRRLLLRVAVSLGKAVCDCYYVQYLDAGLFIFALFLVISLFVDHHCALSPTFPLLPSSHFGQ